MSLRPPTIVQAYGGYLATMLLSSEEFTQLKCGTAVSPITDFELYGMTLQIFFIINYVILLAKRRPIFLTLFFLFSIAASAFSERYLGSKTDSRVYAV